VDDARALASESSMIAVVSPEIQRGGLSVKSPYNAAALTVHGIEPQYQFIRTIDIEKGRSFRHTDEEGALRVAIVGADTWPVEVVPNPNAKIAFPVHQEFIPKAGIFIHENIATERLVEAKVYEFAYIYSPLPIKGGTGSPGNPIAVH